MTLRFLAVLACPFCLFGFRFRLDHPVGEQRDDQGELLLACGLPAQDATCLFRFTAPLAMTMNKRRGNHLLHLFVGVGVHARSKRIKLIPQGGDREIHHLPGNVQQPERVCLDLVRQAERIAQ
jgi:hypothetical protein